PLRRGDLRRPHRVELQHVGVAGVGVQPLDVELMALVGGVSGLAQLNANIGVLLLEAVELPPEDVRLAPDGAGREGDDRPALFRAAAAEQGQEGTDLCQTGKRSQALRDRAALAHGVTPLRWCSL